MTTRQRLARLLRRAADRLEPLPALALDGSDPWGATEIVHCTLRNHGIVLPLTIRPVNRMPAVPKATKRKPPRHMIRPD